MSLARSASQEEELVGVGQWAEIRRMHFVERLSIKEILRRTGRVRKTIRRALRSELPPHYRRPPRPSKLDPFREDIERLLLVVWAGLAWGAGTTIGGSRRPPDGFSVNRWEAWH